MQVKNNYNKQVFNGDIGRIILIDAEERKLTVQFGAIQTDYDYEETDELVLAYTISVHKSQGSEYKAVILPVTTQHYVMLQRNLLYTAITRAKEVVVLIGTKQAIGISVNNNRVAIRHTALKERLLSESPAMIPQSEIEKDFLV
jgi:exodeoxyribonuclease V alpha subunit